MNIQRWHDDGRCFRDPEGEWVTYADHVAEVERVHSYYSNASALWGDGYDHGAEPMRAACIAAVEAALWEADPDPASDYLIKVLAALREVQP